MKKIVLIAVLIVLIAAGGAYALTRNSKNNANTPASSTPAATSSNSNTPGSTTPTATSQNSSPSTSDTTITYNGKGFSPASLTIKAGTTITIKNSSSNILQFDSDPHPDHTDDTELNVGTVSPGKSQTITVNKTGSHGFHNHLNPNQTGMLIVQ